MRVRSEGAYIIRAAESRPSRVPAKAPPPGWSPPVPTARDRAVARALLAYHRDRALGDTKDGER